MRCDRPRNPSRLTSPARHVSSALALASLLFASPLQALPACIPRTEVPHAKVVRVEKNGVIVLADGRAARLEGLLLPAGADDHAPQFVADQAIAAIDSQTTGQPVTLAAQAPKEDRYGRIRAQILVDGKDREIWLQRELLRKGLARVAIAPDRNECAEELYAAEAVARRSGTGLWSSKAYAVRSPSQTDAVSGTFQIVEGTITSVSHKGGRIFLAFGGQTDADFRAIISQDDMKRFREIGVDPFAYANQAVRVRGFVESNRDRPEIELATPAQVEIVEAAP